MFTRFKLWIKKVEDQIFAYMLKVSIKHDLKKIQLERGEKDPPLPESRIVVLHNVSPLRGLPVPYNEKEDFNKTIVYNTRHRISFKKRI